LGPIDESEPALDDRGSYFDESVSAASDQGQLQQGITTDTEFPKCCRRLVKPPATAPLGRFSVLLRLTVVLLVIPSAEMTSV
jgi:hypothetical protein